MPALPLLERSTLHHPLFRLLPEGSTARARSAEAPSIPAEPPGPGQQYRFHFDMTKCIGCHCCEVACNEQNGLPAELPWRRVGEIEGGSYPFAQRFHLSMGCNHCLEPACLIGCPVEAYTKDAETGIVLHNADLCIGCQYCTWNCPYGVPQYDSRRGVVGKCDMCYGRLAEGRAPACVHACPENAIQVEIVDIDEWRRDFALKANAPGMPPAEATVSTTRVTLPETLHENLQRTDLNRVRAEQAHLPLVAMTVLMQLSVGITALSRWVSAPRQLLIALVSSAVAALSLGLSLSHLGRPLQAWRALKMWKRSWLSREVLFFSLYAAASALVPAAIWLQPQLASPAWAAAFLFGVAGIFAGASIYRIPARPAWNQNHTYLEFFLTAASLGAAVVLALGEERRPIVAFCVAGAAAQIVNQTLKWHRLHRSETYELNASAQLLAGPLRNIAIWRLAATAAGALLAAAGHYAVALVLLLSGELLGRYLFFVSVVPRNIASSYLGLKEAA